MPPERLKQGIASGAGSILRHGNTGRGEETVGRRDKREEGHNRKRVERRKQGKEKQARGEEAREQGKGEEQKQERGEEMEKGSGEIGKRRGNISAKEIKWVRGKVKGINGARGKRDERRIQ